MKLFNPGLKFKILTLILIFITVSAFILTYSTYIKLKNDIYQKNSEVFRTFVNTFYSEKDMLIRKYSMSMDILLENKAVVEAFKNRNRERLSTLVTDLYNTRLKHFYDIEQFQFHLPPATSFFRAHVPEKYGDDLSAFRQTVLQANRDKTMITGLEVGRAGLGLRVVKPVWYNYTYLGTVEFGGNIENLLSTPANSTNVEYAVGIFKKSLQRSKFFFQDENRYVYNDMYMYNYSSADIKSLITSGRISEENRIIKQDMNYYMVKNVPLKDFSGNHIGYMLLSRDTTPEVIAMHRELIKQILIIFSYALATVSMLTFVLIRLIFNPLESITNHISSVQTDSALPVEPINIKGNTEIGMLAQAYNILSMKLAESFEKINTHMNEIQVINTSLEKRVQERTKQLEDTNTRLKNAMAEIQLANEAKSEFLASMSHEIRTPMNAILGLSHLIMQTELNSRQYDYVSKVRSSANMLLEIINDVLDFSKIEAGKLELDSTPFDLKESLQKLGSMLDVSIKKKDVELFLDIDSMIPNFLIGDQLRITQVMNNLGTNAAKFTEKGRISVSARLMTKNDNYAKIKITVADTGIGIPKDKIPVLFDSFTQVKRKNLKKQAGSGLGLSITKKILDAMGSDITVTSEESVGTTFEFNLTLEIADAASVDEIKSADGKLSGKRILVCEGKSAEHYGLALFFRENLADVLAAFNQFDMLKHMNSNLDKEGKLLFDLIVMDTDAVDKDVCKSIRSISSADDYGVLPPIVLVSDDHNMANRIAENCSGLNVYIVSKSVMHDKLPELCVSLISYDSSSNPDLKSFKRNRQAGSGMKALIVDDNELNLQVITELSDILGISYKTARNGYEAVKAVDEEDFDIIFMDIIMPEMDGITATTLIRNSSKRPDIPIYALSASTMPDDVEKCRNAGMNGHIAKPVKLQDLTMALKDCSSGYVQPELPSQQTDIELPASDSTLDCDLAVSYLNGNKKLYFELLTKYYNEYTGIDLKQSELFEKNDAEELKVFFHTIKGISRTIGAQDLSIITEELERISAKG